MVTTLNTTAVKSMGINKNLPEELFDPQPAKVDSPSMEEIMKMTQEGGE